MNPRDIRSLDIGMLRTFDALMRERSVSRAAARLFLSQPAVSASLNRLREAFDDPLFTRNAHGVTPTPRAQALAAQVEKVLGDIGALLEAGRAFDPGASDRIFRIAGSDFASRNILPALGRTLAGCGSAIRLVWEPPGTWSLPERLHRGDLDLAVIARLRMPRDMEMRVLYEDHYVYAVRAGHPAAGQPVTLDMFCAVPQIFLGYGSSILDDTWAASAWRKWLSPASARSSTSWRTATMRLCWASAWRRPMRTSCTSVRCRLSCRLISRCCVGTPGLMQTPASSGSRPRSCAS